MAGEDKKSQDRSKTLKEDAPAKTSANTNPPSRTMANTDPPSRK